MKSQFFQRFRTVITFVVLVVMVTLIAGSVYATAQYIFRSSANDPQIEAAQSIAEALTLNIPAESIVGNGNVLDIASNIGVFAIIYDKDGAAVAGSGALNGNIPRPPSGVFDYAREHGENRVTWQPQQDVRIAAVIRKVDDDKGFVLVGRNLKEVENRIQTIGYIVGIPWVLLLIFSGVLTMLFSRNPSTDITLIEETEVIEVSEQPAN